jgi:hypothetical protein
MMMLDQNAVMKGLAASRRLAAFSCVVCQHGKTHPECARAASCDSGLYQENAYASFSRSKLEMF